MKEALEAARDEPDFDAEAADAYLAFRRDDTDEAARKLEACLGSAAGAGDQLTVLYAQVREDGSLGVGVRGRADAVARHFCARGCRSAVFFALQ